MQKSPCFLLVSSLPSKDWWDQTYYELQMVTVKCMGSPYTGALCPGRFIKKLQLCQDPLHGQVGSKLPFEVRKQKRRKGNRKAGNISQWTVRGWSPWDTKIQKHVRVIRFSLSGQSEPKNLVVLERSHMWFLLVWLYYVMVCGYQLMKNSKHLWGPGWARPFPWDHHSQSQSGKSWSHGQGLKFWVGVTQHPDCFVLPLICYCNRKLHSSVANTSVYCI